MLGDSWLLSEDEHFDAVVSSKRCLCYFIEAKQVKEILEGEDLAGLRRLALFRYVYWKISKYKFNNKFIEVVDTIKENLLRTISTKTLDMYFDTSSPMHNNEVASFQKGYFEILLRSRHRRQSA